MTAIRLARARTGRDVVIKFAGAYHGHSDGLLSQAGSGVATQGIPSSPGVPAATAAATVVVPWNDPAALELALERHEVAAIIAEPCPANMGLVPAAPRLPRAAARAQQRMRRAADQRRGDQRLSRRARRRGAAQRRPGDLIVLGKILGGGLPAAALAGPRELLELLAPVGEVYQAGTLSGNPLAVAAGLATLALLDEAAYVRLEATTRALAEGIAGAAGRRPVSVVWVPGLLTVFFAAAPPVELRRRAGLRPRRVRRAGAASCSRAASTPRRPSSRRGSRRWPTPPSSSSRRLRPRVTPSPRSTVRDEHARAAARADRCRGRAARDRPARARARRGAGDALARSPPPGRARAPTPAPTSC